MDAIDGTARGSLLLSCIVHAGIVAAIIFDVPVFLRPKMVPPPPPTTFNIVDAAALARPLHHRAAPDKADSIDSRPAPPPVTGVKTAASHKTTDTVAWQGQDAATQELSWPQKQPWIDRPATVLGWASGEQNASLPKKPIQAAEVVAPPNDPAREAAPDVPPLSVDDQMDSLIKSLSPQAAALEAKKLTKRHGSPNADLSDVADDTPPQRLHVQLTEEELETVRDQVQRCWAYFGNKEAVHGIQVPIHLVLRRNGTLLRAQIVTTGHDGDPVWMSVADSALRALQNPSCSPLQLPPQKYEAWRNAVLTFSP